MSEAPSSLVEHPHLTHLPELIEIAAVVAAGYQKIVAKAAENAGSFGVQAVVIVVDQVTLGYQKNWGTVDSEPDRMNLGSSC